MDNRSPIDENDYPIAGSDQSMLTKSPYDILKNLDDMPDESRNKKLFFFKGFKEQNFFLVFFGGHRYLGRSTGSNQGNQRIFLRCF
jgi:hypothetical protein